MRTRTLTGVVIGGLLLGSAATALIVPTLVAAADPSAAPSASPTATTAPSTNEDTSGSDNHAFGGRNETVSDTSVVAKAIGITETALATELQAGKTVADVAKAHSVTVQTVIDALVADGKSELAAAVKAGTITQAQADAETANLTQRATDQVNGTFGPGGRGGGHGDHHGFGGPDGQPSNGVTPSASPTTSG